MEAPAPAGARAGLACGPALLGQLSAPRAQATPPLADAAAALYTVLGSGDEAGFQDASVALAARYALLFLPVPVFPAALDAARARSRRV